MQNAGGPEGHRVMVLRGGQDEEAVAQDGEEAAAPETAVTTPVKLGRKPKAGAEEGDEQVSASPPGALLEAEPPAHEPEAAHEAAAVHEPEAAHEPAAAPEAAPEAALEATGEEGAAVGHGDAASVGEGVVEDAAAGGEGVVEDEAAGGAAEAAAVVGHEASPPCETVACPGRGLHQD